MEIPVLSKFFETPTVRYRANKAYCYQPVHLGLSTVSGRYTNDLVLDDVHSRSYHFLYEKSTNHVGCQANAKSVVLIKQ